MQTVISHIFEVCHIVYREYVRLRWTFNEFSENKKIPESKFRLAVTVRCLINNYCFMNSRLFVNLYLFRTTNIDRHNRVTMNTNV